MFSTTTGIKARTIHAALTLVRAALVFPTLFWWRANGWTVKGKGGRNLVVR